MEAGRRNDEARELLATRLPADGIPVIRPGRRPAPSEPLQAAMLRLVDGERTIQQILDDTAVPGHDLLCMLAEMIEADALSVRRLAPARLQTGSTRSSSALGGRVLLIASVVILLVSSIAVGAHFWLQTLRTPPGH